MYCTGDTILRSLPSAGKWYYLPYLQLASDGIYIKLRIKIYCFDDGVIKGLATSAKEKPKFGKHIFGKSDIMAPMTCSGQENESEVYLTCLFWIHSVCMSSTCAYIGCLPAKHQIKSAEKKLNTQPDVASHTQNVVNYNIFRIPLGNGRLTILKRSQEMVSTDTPS